MKYILLCRGVDGDLRVFLADENSPVCEFETKEEIEALIGSLDEDVERFRDYQIVEVEI